MTKNLTNRKRLIVAKIAKTVLLLLIVGSMFTSSSYAYEYTDWEPASPEEYQEATQKDCNSAYSSECPREWCRENKACYTKRKMPVPFFDRYIYAKSPNCLLDNKYKLSFCYQSGSTPTTPNPPGNSEPTNPTNPNPPGDPSSTNPSDPSDSKTKADETCVSKCLTGTSKSRKDCEKECGGKGSVDGGDVPSSVPETELITPPSGEDGIMWLLKQAIKILSGLVGAVAVVMFIFAGVSYAAAGDNSEKVQKAKEMMRNTVIGILLYLFMFAILNFIIPGGVFK